MAKDIKALAQREALSGRLPTLHGERIYDRYTTFLWTCTAFSAATWAFLIGGFLPFVGNTKVGILGYLAGVMVGMVLVTLAAGMASNRYGVDTTDAAKASFGVRGTVIPLIGLMATMVGWTAVLVALTSRGAGNVAQTASGAEGPSETFIVIVGLAAVALCWLVTARGPQLFERISNYVAPLHLVLTAIMLIVLFVKFGGGLLDANVPASEAFTTDRTKGYLLAFEFGMANALTWWPVMGGLTRLVKRQRQIIGPSVVGVGVLGAAFLSSVAAFAAVKAGTPDPTIWMIQIGGDVFGSAVLLFVLTANIAAMVILMYLGGVAIQQIGPLARARWGLIIGVMLIPSLLAALNSQWVLDNMIKWLTYNGVMFAGITGVTLVDYFLLRRQELDARHLFSRSSGSKYWFWGGVNLVAVAVVAVSLWFDLWLYDPISLETQGIFDIAGSSLPTILLSGLVYYVGMRLVAIPLGKGTYPQPAAVTDGPRLGVGQTPDVPVTL
jgi:nucleobase:cation symporter-1, NCS1 family